MSIFKEEVNFNTRNENGLENLRLCINADEFF